MLFVQQAALLMAPIARDINLASRIDDVAAVSRCIFGGDENCSALRWRIRYRGPSLRARRSRHGMLPHHSRTSLCFHSRDRTSVVDMSNRRS